MLIILINETKFIIQIENRNYNIIMKFMMKFFKSKIQTNTRFIQENRLSIIPILPKCIIIIKKNHDFTCGVTYIFWFCSSYFFFLMKQHLQYLCYQVEIIKNSEKNKISRASVPTQIPSCRLILYQ